MAIEILKLRAPEPAVLPAAGWGEKEGIFINSERRLGVARKVARAPGTALSDFAIFKLVAEAWGCGDLFRAIWVVERRSSFRQNICNSAKTFMQSQCNGHESNSFGK